MDLNTIETKHIKAVVGKQEMQQVSSSKFVSKHPLVSIQDPDDTINLSPFHKKWKSFIHLKFFDVEEETLSSNKKLLPMNKEQAIRLIEFILDNKNEQFFIHCEAGVSRSAGVAMAIDCILEFNGDIHSFNQFPHPIVSHMRYTPNYQVFNLLIDTYNEVKTTSNDKICPTCLSSFEKEISGLKNGKKVSFCPHCFSVV